jgi:hypothetical protein
VTNTRPASQPMTSSDTCARILRPPLWLATAFMDQFFQNIEAVARRIDTYRWYGILT